MDQQLSKLDNFDSVEGMLGMCETLIESGFLAKNLNKPAKVAAIIMQGRELGFGAVTSLNNIHNIQGKPTLSIHAIAAKVKQAGFKYKLVEDAVFVGKDGTTSKIKIEDGVSQSVDQRTTIRFYEMMGNTVIENDMTFLFSEAVAMGLSGKDNWMKMRTIMMRNRCLAIGARFVAPHAILGMMESTEWADVVNQNVLVDSEGKVIEIVE